MSGMMKRYLLLLAFAPTVFGQSSETTLTQTLINEIHALRQDIEAITVASQRVQIALYRLQSQTALVAVAQDVAAKVSVLNFLNQNNVIPITEIG